MGGISFRTIRQDDASILQRAQGAFHAASTLADVLAVGRALHPPANVAEIVTQDEYTHDVIMPFGPTHYLSFDTT